MNTIFQSLARILNLMLYPTKEWDRIAAENNNRRTIFLRFVAPLLCLTAIATIIGTWLATPRELYSAGFVIFKIFHLCISISAGLFFSAFVITEIMAHQVDQRDHNRSFALMAYASGAAFLVIFIVEMFPFFNELLVLAFYSCYLYWRGIPHLIQVSGQKQMIYTLLSFIIMVLIFSLTFFFFGKILGTIFL